MRSRLISPIFSVIGTMFVALCLASAQADTDASADSDAKAEPKAATGGDAKAGEARAVVCAGCHGIDGNSLNPEWPTLAGQHQDYIINQLNNFQQGRRQNALMSPMSMGLTPTDMANLAAFYSSQETKTNEVDPAIADRGRALYYVGDPSKGIPACVACHGPTGRGNAPGGMPMLSGQRSGYVVKQLREYADGTRAGQSDTKTAMMQQTAQMLSPEDMAAVAGFIQGLN
ncbi:MAG: c-type cytochrome [Pseudomonadota bacterium]